MCKQFSQCIKDATPEEREVFNLMKSNSLVYQQPQEDQILFCATMNSSGYVTKDGRIMHSYIR